MRIQSNINCYLLLVSMQNGTATSAVNLAASDKIKHILLIRSSNQALHFNYLKKLSLFWHKNLHMDFYSRFIQTVTTWKQPRCPSVGEWINCDIFKQWNIIQYQKERSWKRHDEMSFITYYKVYYITKYITLHITKWKKLTLKGYLVYDYNYITFWKRQNNKTVKQSGSGSVQ